MRLPSDIRFADESIREAFYKLEKGDDSERELFKFINQALDNIERNAFCGIQIPKRLIPKEYITKYGVKKYLKLMGWSIPDIANTIRELNFFTKDLMENSK